MFSHVSYAPTQAQNDHGQKLETHIRTTTQPLPARNVDQIDTVQQQIKIPFFLSSYFHLQDITELG